MQYQSLYYSGFPCGPLELDESFATPLSVEPMLRPFRGPIPTRILHRATRSIADSQFDDPPTRIPHTKGLVMDLLSTAKADILAPGQQRFHQV